MWSCTISGSRISFSPVGCRAQAMRTDTQSALSKELIKLYLTSHLELSISWFCQTPTFLKTQPDQVRSRSYWLFVLNTMTTNIVTVWICVDSDNILKFNALILILYLDWEFLLCWLRVFCLVHRVWWSSFRHRSCRRRNRSYRFDVRRLANIPSTVPCITALVSNYHSYTCC